MKIEDFKEYFDTTLEVYKFSKEELESILNNTNEKTSVKFTENGIKILKCMQENQDTYMNVFNSKQIGELLFMSPRSVSGSMKKLINTGYVEKVGVSPVSYGLTDQGKCAQFDN